MRMFIGTVCFTLTVAVFAAEIVPKDNPIYDYHRRLGIPKARKIQNLENNQVVQNKIVGGQVTDITETPYLAGVIVQILPIFTSVCGATLISSTRLLTAAHCQYDGVFTAQHFTVVLGSNTLFRGGLRIVTSNVVVHPEWNPSNLANDIAVIRVDTVTYSNTIRPISLPLGNEINDDFVGWEAVASGFGLTRTDGTIANNQPISSVTLPVISNIECDRVFSGFIRDTNICASGEGGRGTCNGDSGGPLAVRIGNRNVVIGLASFGSSRGCEAGLPSAFSRVSSYVNWIRSQ
ncbi:hypothetical protein PYW08_011822 [Mythimna loreyi]|uniref:Uncharacterized protein n=1 Tax=Mythimna loreyi TaxID=667449 RepID=A0ACC2QMM1_9NEOP|nr:hypothetical protein PYW08_011822 [Mythimna loreyi]